MVKVWGCGVMRQLSASTLAARPVGAMSTTFWSIASIVRTTAAAKEVLPVPAEPRIIITTCSSRQPRKRPSTLSARCCEAVGTWPSCTVTRWIKSSISMAVSKTFCIFAVAKILIYRKKAKQIELFRHCYPMPRT